MKLSEIINKIYDMNYRGECWVAVSTSKGDNYTKIRIEYGDGYWGLYEFYINPHTKTIINDIDLPITDEWKWLWKLWADNVEIEIDEVTKNEN